MWYVLAVNRKQISFDKVVGRERFLTMEICVLVNCVHHEVVTVGKEQLINRTKHNDARQYFYRSTP